MENALRIAAVCTANEQENIGFGSADVIQIILSQLEGVNAHHLCACAKAGHFCSLTGQFGHKAAGDHAKSACCRRTSIGLLEGNITDLLTQKSQSIFQTVIDVGLDGGKGLGSA